MASDTTPDHFFHMLGDSTRLRIMILLAREEELCVTQFKRAMEVPQTKISHHIALLLAAGLVLRRRDGNWQYYRINPELSEWGRPVLEAAAAGLKEEEPFLEDFKRLPIFLPEQLKNTANKNAK